MNIASLSSVKLHWQEDGDPEGAPVVFANSLGTDLRLWDKTVAALPAGLRVIRFDKRGHGLSECPDGPYSMEALVQDTEELMDHLGLQACAFVGLSIGGMIGQGLAAKRPDLVKALVLSNTAAKMGDAAMWAARMQVVSEQGLAAHSDAIMERWFAPAFRASDECAAWRAMVERTPAAGYLGCCAAIKAADLGDTTRTLDLPVLGIAGDADGASPPDVVEATTRMIAGARFHVIEGAGHLPCVEKPDDYAAILNPFLKEVCHV